VLVYALTGKAPYSGDSDEATLWAHLNAPPPSESVPPDFEGVVARALAKDPSDRFLSAGDLGRAALRAAGRSATAVPERNVGRGLAAPATDDSAATPLRGAAAPVRSDPEGETRLSPAAGGTRAMPTAVAAPAPRGAVSAALAGRRRSVLAGAAALVVAAGIAIAVLGGSGDDAGKDDDQQATQTQTQTTDGPAGRRRSVAAPPDTDTLTRPNALTIAAGKVWAISSADGTILVVDATTGKRLGRIPVGKTGSSLAGGFNSVWVTKSTTPSILRFNAKTRGRVRNWLVEIPRPGRNVAVATGAGAVWVAVRNESDSDHSPEAIVRVDPSTGDRKIIDVSNGVQDLAVGFGAVWVTNRFSSTVTRIDVRTGKQRQVPVGPTPKGIAVGEGGVWVAASGGDEVTRINPKTLQRTTIEVDAVPERITVGGGSVWVTAQEAGRLIRISPRTFKVRETIDTASRPFAVDVSRGRAVWLTLLDGNGLQRVRFYR